MRIIIFDTRENFISDIQLQMMIGDWNNEILEVSSSPEDVMGLIANNNPELVVVADNAAFGHNDWNFATCKTVGYLTSKNTPNPFKDMNVSVLGVVRSSEHLLNLLENPSVISFEQTVNIPVKPVEENIISTPKIENKTIHKNPVYQSDYNNPLNKDNNFTEKETLDEASSSQNSPSVNPSKNNITVKEKLNNASLIREQEEAQAHIKRNLESKKKKPKVVTVYAAKGGVGKTTISCELATYLSRISIGRGYLRVCIIDCNIDFGDVLTTLDYNPEGNNLSYWAAEVKERIQRGEKLSDIKYSKSEIEERLQKSEETGLYALIAPITHEDSMDIEEKELQVILDNIIENGEFDFVICDTGNNTRDSSMLALEKANEILLIVTQDVSTASCNTAFLSTMEKIDFDTSKIKLIVNSIMPYKYTHISVQELIDTFEYECIAQIKRDPEVVAANNMSKPIVLEDPNHNFTKEIKKIADYLLGDESNIDNQVKKNLFSKLFRRG